MKRIYDQAMLCQGCNQCPVVDLDEKTGKVIVSDPSAPAQGKFEFKNAEEYNAFLANAPRLPAR